MSPRCETCPLGAGLSCPGERQPGRAICRWHEADPATWRRAIESNARPRAPEPPLPPLAAMAANKLRADVRHARRHFEPAPAELAAARVATCEGCPRFRPTDRRCSHAKCGCPVEAKAARMAEACPEGRWPEPATAPA